MSSAIGYIEAEAVVPVLTGCPVCKRKECKISKVVLQFNTEGPIKAERYFFCPGCKRRRFDRRDLQPFQWEQMKSSFRITANTMEKK